MKNTSKWAMLAVLAGCLSACATQEVEAPLPVKQQGTRVHFVAGTPETKTAFAEPTVEDGVATYPTRWTANDTEVAISLNYETAIAAGVVPSADFTQADFEADFAESKASAPYTFYVLSPASALKAVSASRKALTVEIPAVQTPIANSADEAAQILVAKSAESQTLPEKVDVHFAHLTGYGRLTMKNLPEGVTSVTLVSPEQPWAGTWYYNTEDGSVEAKEASSSITLKTDGTGDIWFACAPVDMKGKKLKVSATTANGVYEREITLSGKNVDFTAGHVYKFSVNMESAEFIENTKEVYYELVTDASTLKAGDEVIIANVPDNKLSSYYAMSTGYQTKYRETISVTVEENKIYDPAENVEIFTLENGTSSGTLSFKSKAGAYIAAGGTNKNSMTNTTTKGATSSWRISISGGTATMVAQSGSYIYLLFNYNQTPYRFACYQASNANNLNMMSKVALYRKTEGETIPSSDDPILQEETFGEYLTSGENLYIKGSQQLSREYQGDKVIFAILDAEAQTVIEFSGIPAAATMGDSFTLVRRTVEGKKTTSTQSYDVTVVGEAGSKLWLSDGAGNAFIVKR